jgi:multiple sugar transport system permease protein
MMGRAFGGVQFGLASAYGFLLTLAIILVTALLYALRSWSNRR